MFALYLEQIMKIDAVTTPSKGAILDKSKKASHSIPHLFGANKVQI